MAAPARLTSVLPALLSAQPREELLLNPGDSQTTRVLLSPGSSPAHLVDGDGRVHHHPPDDLGFIGHLGLPLLGLGHHGRLRDLGGRGDAAALRHLREKDRMRSMTWARSPMPELGTTTSVLLNAAMSL